MAAILAAFFVIPVAIIDVTHRFRLKSRKLSGWVPMRDRKPAPGGYKADYVEARFEAAGRTLVALPWAGCFPAGITCLWPEAGGGELARWSVPDAAEISAMTECYHGWIPLISDADPLRLVMMRRLVLMRSLVMPDSPADSPRYVYSWRRLGKMTGLHADTLISRWGWGIDAITRRLNKPGLCRASGGKIGPSPEAVFAAAFGMPAAV